MNNDEKPDTWLAQAGHMIDPDTGSVAPPMHTAATFARDEGYDTRAGYMYSRYGNPTTDQAEAILTRLEGADDTLLFNSGLSAAAAILESLPKGAKVVAPKVMYFGVLVWMRRLATKDQIKLFLYEPGNSQSLEAAAGQSADLIWVETPANPDWSITSIAHAAGVSRAVGAKLAVDGTCAPPLTTRALDFGADYAFHSATKYLNGHSDVTGGVVSVAKLTEQWNDIKEIRKLQGTILPGFESWLLIRGLRTLGVRWDKSCENAIAVAKHFEGHTALEDVVYPGLTSHPGHETALSQMTRGFGGMMSFLVRGGFDAGRQLAQNTKIFIPATSLGGVESLIEHRKTIEGDATDVAPNLVRLSVGIEDANDLIADIEAALSETRPN